MIKTTSLTFGFYCFSSYIFSVFPKNYFFLIIQSCVTKLIEFEDVLVMTLVYTVPVYLISALFITLLLF